MGVMAISGRYLAKPPIGTAVTASRLIDASDFSTADESTLPLRISFGISMSVTRPRGLRHKQNHRRVSLLSPLDFLFLDCARRISVIFWNCPT
jgi:hypothetical protein